MTFSCFVISLIVSVLLSVANIQISNADEQVKEDNKETTEESKEKTTETKSETKETPKEETKQQSIIKTTEKEVSTSYETYPITVPKTELPEDVHIVESNMSLGNVNKQSGIPEINISVKKGNMKMNLNIDPTYSDLYFDINLKDIDVEDAEVPKDYRQKEKSKAKAEELEKTAQQERLLNQIDEMMRALEKSRQSEKDLKDQKDKNQKDREQQEKAKELETKAKELEAKEREKKEVLTKREIDNKNFEHIEKSQKLYYKKKYGLALKEVQEGLKLNPTAMGYALEGTIYLALDDTTSAVNSWKKSLEINPNMKDIKELLEYYQTEEEQ